MCLTVCVSQILPRCPHVYVSNVLLACLSLCASQVLPMYAGGCVSLVLPIAHVSLSVPHRSCSLIMCLTVSHRSCSLLMCLSVYISHVLPFAHVSHYLCLTSPAHCTCVFVSQVLPFAHVSQCLSHKSCPCVSVSVCVSQVLPFAHVSGSAKYGVHLINPNAVNLKEYEEKLEKALAKYRQ